MTTATMAPPVDQPGTHPANEQQAIAELVEQLVADQDQKEADVSSRESAAVTLTLAVNAEQRSAGMHGWITYIDREVPNRTYSAATRITVRVGKFAGGSAVPSLVLSPEQVAGKTGTFHAGGFGPAGLLQMWVDGKPVFAVRIPVGGVGEGYWRVDGEVRFSPLQ